MFLSIIVSFFGIVGIFIFLPVILSTGDLFIGVVFLFQVIRAVAVLVLLAAVICVLFGLGGMPIVFLVFRIPVFPIFLF